MQFHGEEEVKKANKDRIEGKRNRSDTENRRDRKKSSQHQAWIHETITATKNEQ